LQNYLVAHLPNLGEVFFLQGTAPHKEKDAKDYFKGVSPGRCIASDGSILWPAQSPDDDQPRYVKNMSYQQNLNKKGRTRTVLR